MIPRLTNLPAFSLLLTSLLCITLLTGCPTAQQPTVPPQDEEDQGQSTPTVPDDGFNRPIEPPDIDGGTKTSGPGGSTSPDFDDQGGGDGQDSGEQVSVSIDEPTDPVTVRLGTVVYLVFDLFDATGAVTSGELVVARDNDGDGIADDGDKPVIVQTFAITGGTNTVPFNTNDTVAAGLLTNSFGRFVLGVRTKTTSDAVTTEYGPGTITVDGVEPAVTWVGAGPDEGSLDREDHLVSRDTFWTIQLITTDNSPHTLRVVLDQDQNPDNGSDFEFVPTTTLAAGGTYTFATSLQAVASRTYYYCVTVSDGVVPPPGALYAPGAVSGTHSRLAVTTRLIGEFDLDQLAQAAPVPSQSKGAIVEGFNFNDLAGSSMVSVPDLDGDGDSELVIGARFGKPNLSTSLEGTGWGEAYLIYGGGGMRLTGENELNSVGSTDDPSGGGIPGVTFRGIRMPQNTDYTEGLADITVIEDMDGDALPELVFSFPRVESLSLKSPAPFQHPDLLRDIAGAGNLEYDAVNPMTQSWTENVAQFTRGGIVIISSHNQLLTDPGQVTRKFDRVLDLHEVGQMFSWMTRPSVAPYIFDIWSLGAGCIDCADQTPCDGEGEYETEFTAWLVWWDVWLGGG